MNYTRERPPDYLAALGARDHPLCPMPDRGGRHDVLRRVRMGKSDGAQRFVRAG